MKSAINVGNDLKEMDSTINAIAGAIVAIMVAGNENKAEQETIRMALNALRDTAAVHGVTIQNSTFTGDKVVNMDKLDDDLL